MRDFPSCFGENGVQVADASCSSAAGVGASKASQNSVSSVYKCRLLGKSCFITVVWSKTLIGQSLTVEIDDASHHQSICKVDVKTSLFSKRKGSKSLELTSAKTDVFWDLSLAKFGAGPEPTEGYYVAVVSKGEMVLAVGDLKKEAFKKTAAKAPLSNPLFISKKEHLFGKKSYFTKAQFYDNGPIHELKIEYCDANDAVDDPYLAVRIDAKTVMQVKHLKWKFRGNNTVLIDGLAVEVFWDLHSWLFGSSHGCAVFMFQTSLSAWAGPGPSPSSLICDTSSSSKMFSWNLSDSSKESKISGLGFTLFLYAWKNE